MIKVLIVDDEPIAQQIMQDYVQMCPGFSVAATCKNALEAFSFLSNNKTDLLLLDINMPEISGMQLLKSLKEPPLVIFTTAYASYAVESYELNAVDYLLKPIGFERFEKALQKVKAVLESAENINETSGHFLSENNNTNKFIFVKADGKLLKINLSELHFIEALKDYVRLWLPTERIVIHSTMKKLEHELQHHTEFIRINKSYIVNLQFIIEFNSAYVKINEHKISIGNTYKEAVKCAFQQFKTF